MTVLELFLVTIKKAYEHLSSAGEIPKPEAKIQKADTLIFDRLTTQGVKGYLIDVMAHNLPRLGKSI